VLIAASVGVVVGIYLTLQPGSYFWRVSREYEAHSIESPVAGSVETLPAIIEPTNETFLGLTKADSDSLAIPASSERAQIQHLPVLLPSAWLGTKIGRFVVADQSSIKVPEHSSARDLAAVEPNLKVQVDGVEVAKKSRPTEISFSIGKSINFTSYRQTVSSSLPIEYADIEAGGSSFRGVFESSDFGFELGYFSSPSSIQSPDASLSGRKILANTYNAEALFALFETISDSGWSTRGRVRAGGQVHYFPLANPEFLSLQFSTYQLTTFSLGFDLWLQTSRRWRHQVLKRLQEPLGVSRSGLADLDFAPKYVLDGSIGSELLMSAGMTVGVFWFGQALESKYSYLNSDGLRDSGIQRLLYSNIELRFGFQF
jgi:hypothetical protein